MSITPGDQPRRYSVGVIALSLTFLILGVVLATVYRIREENTKLQDVEFLQKQLSQLQTAGMMRHVARPPALVRVDLARSGEIPEIRTFQGRLLEVKNTTLSSEVTGLVLELPIEVGDFVKAGETLIARIDDTWTKFTHETAGRDIELKTTILDYEKTETERLQQLIESRAVSVSEYLLQVNKTDQIRTNLEISKLIRDESAEKLNRTEIRAPFDGHVIAKMTEVGSLLSPGNPIVQIISSGEIDAEIPVNQTVVDRIRIGDEIAVDLENIGLKVRGKVHKIVPHAPREGGRMFPVLVRLPNENERLKSGMAVTGRFPASDPTPGIIVPVEAMMDKPDGRTVWVAIREPADGDRAERVTVQPVPVKLLAHSVDTCSVESETEEGKTLLADKVLVVIEGSERLTPGQIVAIKEVDPIYLENLPMGSGHAVVREEEKETKGDGK